jgi:hypothetical protein
VAGAVNPYAQLPDVVLLSGATTAYPTEVSSATPTPTSCGAPSAARWATAAPSSRPTSPPPERAVDLFSAPCAERQLRLRLSDQCDGNVVEYTTVTMEDLPDGALQDEFISEESSALDHEPCVENELITLGGLRPQRLLLQRRPRLLRQPLRVGALRRGHRAGPAEARRLSEPPHGAGAPPRREAFVPGEGDPMIDRGMRILARVRRVVGGDGLRTGTGRGPPAPVAAPGPAPPRRRRWRRSRPRRTSTSPRPRRSRRSTRRRRCSAPSRRRT